jgi:hypothetical protein
MLEEYLTEIVSGRLTLSGAGEATLVLNGRPLQQT